MKVCSPVSSLKTWFLTHRARILEVGIGRSLYAAFNFVFDDIAYPAAIAMFGWKGALAMSIASFVQCALTLMWYQHCGRDWLGIGVIEEVRQEGHGKIERFMKMRWEGKKAVLLFFVKMILGIPVGFWWGIIWMLNRNKVWVFLALGMVQDPFQTTAYFKRADFSSKTLERRDWVILIASWAWSNFYWTIRSSVVAFVVMMIWGKTVGQ